MATFVPEPWVARRPSGVSAGGAMATEPADARGGYT